jgi:hypothetical protein
MARIFPPEVTKYTPKEAESARGCATLGGYLMPFLALPIIWGQGEQILRHFEISSQVGDVIQIFLTLGTPYLIFKVLLPDRIKEIASRTGEDMPS